MPETLALEKACYACRNCKLVYDDDPGPLRPQSEDAPYWHLRNGMSMNLGDGLPPIPFHSSIVPCAHHLALLEAAFPEEDD